MYFISAYDEKGRLLNIICSTGVKSLDPLSWSWTVAKYNKSTAFKCEKNALQILLKTIDKYKFSSCK